MKTARLEAFSDGVLAIIITIMVLEMKVPHTDDVEALGSVLPIFLSYVMSFVYLGIYWNNHHHLLRATQRISGGVMWANMHLLFWLSVVPFFTGWMGENHFQPVPTALYGCVLLMAAIAYYVLQWTIIRFEGEESLVLKAIRQDSKITEWKFLSALRDDWKGKVSPILYTIGIVASLKIQWLGIAMYVLVALIWLIPDKRIERMFIKMDSELESEG